MKRLVAILLSAILISPETFVHAKAADLAAEVPESSPSSPPLETDDPGTPGRHGYEINFIVNCDRAIQIGRVKPVSTRPLDSVIKLNCEYPNTYSRRGSLARPH